MNRKITKKAKYKKDVKLNLQKKDSKLPTKVGETVQKKDGILRPGLKSKFYYKNNNLFEVFTL